ncbi:MAG TPA: hypothetical protein VHW69_07190 [Rhizomicrobium sp.]|nr:hypothetical protein [Rhizomicrobium sp.]
MFSDHAENQVFGEDVLNLGLIAGAAFVFLATLWTTASPSTPVLRASTQPIEQVVVVAHPHPGRVS